MTGKYGMSKETRNIKINIKKIHNHINIFIGLSINLTLEASEMFLSLYMIFSLERAAVVWAILERISGLDPRWR